MLNTVKTDLVPLLPRLPVPALRVPLVGGGHYDLAAERPRLFSMIVFYRGLHCQQCQAYLGELERLLPEFENRGITNVAISCDGEGSRREREGRMGAHIYARGLRPDAARCARLGAVLNRGQAPTTGSFRAALLLRACALPCCA